MTDGNADEQWMAAAIAEARLAEAKGEVPVGAVIVHEGQVIGRGHNLRESSQDPTTHAEMIAIQEAAKELGSWRLIDTSLYVTLEPCPMCAVWGCDDPKAGATQTLYRIGSDDRLNHRFECVPGVLGDECGALLTRFFAAIRAKNRPRNGR
jgi:tRNA(adenine34) deaminase